MCREVRLSSAHLRKTHAPQHLSLPLILDEPLARGRLDKPTAADQPSSNEARRGEARDVIGTEANGMRGVGRPHIGQAAEDDSLEGHAVKRTCRERGAFVATNSNTCRRGVSEMSVDMAAAQ
jgi:hypothetical protein